MKLSRNEARDATIERCGCASACDGACIAQAEQDKMFQNLLRYGFRPL